VTSHEVIDAAMNFKGPDRCPVDCLSLDITDFYHCYPESPGPTHARGAVGQEVTDRWGCVWTTLAENLGQCVGHPLADWDAFTKYRFPNALDGDPFRTYGERLAQNPDKYLISGAGEGFLERASKLRGMADLFLDFALYPERVHELLDGILRFNLDMVKQYGVHGGPGLLAVLDDLGTQNNLFFSIETWRQFFRPRYKALIDAVHGIGMKFGLHTDGMINKLIPEFLDLGIDVINLMQPLLLGVDEISALARGKICFWNPVDIQSTLPKGNREEIYTQAEELLRKWGTPQGGFIAQDYPDFEAIGSSRETMRTMYEAFVEAGRSVYAANVRD